MKISLETRITKAREAIEWICHVYDVDVCPKYDDGVAVLVVGEEPAPSGGTVTMDTEVCA